MTKTLADLIAEWQVKLHNFPFSTPVGKGEFTDLRCPVCKERQFVCKECIKPLLADAMRAAHDNGYELSSM